MTVVRACGLRVSTLTWLSDFYGNYLVPSGTQRTWFRFASVLCCLLLTHVPARSQRMVGAVPVGNGPNSVAINPITNKIYVTNQLDNNLTEIDGSKDVARTIPLHPFCTPMALAVNSVTNKIYVACQFGNSFAGEIAVIDANNNNATTFTSLPPFPNPFAIAVDPVTNLVFVLNQQFGITVSVFDANMFLKQTITLGNVSGGQSQISAPAIAIDSQHGKVYVTGVIGSFGEGVSIIDEKHLADTPLNVGVFAPGPIVVDEVTNKALVLGFGQSNGVNFPEVVVIDGGNCQTTNPELPNCPSTPIQLGSFGPLVLNPATHKAYAASGAGVTVIDTSQPGFPTTFVSVPSTTVQGLAVNPSTNKIYASTGSTVGVAGSIFVIDGTNDTLLPGSAVLTGPSFIRALNPITNRIYATDPDDKLLAVIDGADEAVASVTDLNAGNPRDVAVNPVTHKVYMANQGGTITVFNPQLQSNNITSISDPNAFAPVAVALNPLTNMVYVANFTTGNVTVVNGATDTYETTIRDPNAAGSFAIAVNPAVNKVYVANNESNNVTVIDGSTNTVIQTLTGIPAPFALAVNNFTPSCRPGPTSHKVYVTSNTQPGTVKEIDGDSDTITNSIPVGSSPEGIAVSPCPVNQVWVANDGSNNVTMFDAEFFSTVSVTDPTATNPRSVGVNPFTNKIYIGNFSSDNVTIIDGNTFGFPFVTVPVGSGPVRLAVNPNSGHVYLANFDGSSVSIIDGPSNSVETLNDPNGSGEDGLAIDPTTNEVFVANFNGSSPASDSMAVISEERTRQVPLQTNVVPFLENIAPGPTPTFNFTAGSAFGPPAPAIDNLFFQFDSTAGPWSTAASAGSNAFTAMPTLEPGFHVLYAFATDSRELSSGISFQAQTISPFTGSIVAYPFFVGATLTFPQIANISPSSGTIGTQITINGSNFGSSQSSSTVMIGGVNAGTAISWSSNQIMIDVPFGADLTSNNAPVMVIVNGDASNSVIFTILQEADLSVTGSAAPDPVNAGNNLTYTFNLHNAGPSYATSVVFSDVLPAAVNFVSVTLTPSILGSCLQASGTVTCNLQLAGTIGNATVTIVVTPTATGSLVTTGTVSSNLTDPNPANNTATVTTTVNPAAQVIVVVTASPAGPSFTVDGTTYNTAQTLTWAQGSLHTIGTTSPQTSSTGTLFNFANWSDGGAGSHTVTAPTTPTTYTANFNAAIPVTSQVSETSSGLLFNRITHIFSGTLTITNPGAAISGPVQVLFNNLNPAVTLVNASGTYLGTPFITLVNGLAPGQSVQVPIQLLDPSLVSPNLTLPLTVYSGVL